MSSSMTMVDFNKNLIDLENKVTRHAEENKELQDTTKRIENQLEHNHNKFKGDHAILSNNIDQNHDAAIIAHNEAMATLNSICEKLKITPDQLPQNNESTQQCHQDPSNTSNSAK